MAKKTVGETIGYPDSRSSMADEPRQYHTPENSVTGYDKPEESDEDKAARVRAERARDARGQAANDEANINNLGSNPRKK